MLAVRAQAGRAFARGVARQNIATVGWCGTILTRPTPRNNFATSTSNSKDDDNKNETVVVYEGPFAALSLRLKRVSMSSAAVSLVGIPLLVYFNGEAIPASGQMAVGGTALFAATGSTIALSYCFSPYVHTLERVPIRNESCPSQSSSADDAELQYLIKARTRNILGLQVETVFDPASDISEPSGNRPFCNFEAKGKALYIHPEMLYDQTLRTQLLGVIEEENPEQKQAFSKKDDDDFL